MCPSPDGLSPAEDRRIPSVDLEVFELPTIVDARGSLTICEFGRHLPFTPKRIFFIRDVPEGVDRGGHAHRKCHQIWVCAQGAMRLGVWNGTERRDYLLDDPGRGHLVPAGLWNDLCAFEPGTVLLCITSEPYDASDYVHTAEEYASWVANRV